MAKEIQATSATGRTIYAHIFNNVGLIWNGSAFETYATANIATYPVTMTEQGTASQVYMGTFPAAIPVGVYSILARHKTTGAFLEADAIVGSDNVHWSGSVLQYLGTPQTTDLTAAIATLDDFVDTEIADIQTRLPAALVDGAIPANVYGFNGQTFFVQVGADVTRAFLELFGQDEAFGYRGPLEVIREDGFGLPTANLGTRLDTLDDFIDTEIAAMPASVWANVTRTLTSVASAGVTAEEVWAYVRRTLTSKDKPTWVGLVHENGEMEPVFIGDSYYAAQDRAITWRLYNCPDLTEAEVTFLARHQDPDTLLFEKGMTATYVPTIPGDPGHWNVKMDDISAAETLLLTEGTYHAGIRAEWSGTATATSDDEQPATILEIPNGMVVRKQPWAL